MLELTGLTAAGHPPLVHVRTPSRDPLAGVLPGLGGTLVAREGDDLVVADLEDAFLDLTRDGASIR